MGGRDPASHLTAHPIHGASPRRRSQTWRAQNLPKHGARPRFFAKGEEGEEGAKSVERPSEPAPHPCTRGNFVGQQGESLVRSFYGAKRSNETLQRNAPTKRADVVNPCAPQNALSVPGAQYRAHRHPSLTPNFPRHLRCGAAPVSAAWALGALFFLFSLGEPSGRLPVCLAWAEPRASGSLRVGLVDSLRREQGGAPRCDAGTRAHPVRAGI